MLKRHRNCGAGLLGVDASQVTIAHLRFINIRSQVGRPDQEIAIVVRAGDPGGALHISDVRIEDNLFDNDGQGGVGLWIGSNVPGVLKRQGVVYFSRGAVGVTVSRITVSRNTFRGLSGDSIDVDLVGAGCTVENLTITDNTFQGGAAAIMLDPVGTNNLITRTRILRNRFSGTRSGVGLAIRTESVTTTTGNLISGTVISQNVFTGSVLGSAVGLSGGDASWGGTVTGNALVGTEISNNLITNSTCTYCDGIYLLGGRGGATGNRIEGLQIASGTVAYNRNAIVIDADAAHNNRVTGVTVASSIFWMNPPGDFAGPTLSCPVRWLVGDRRRWVRGHEWEHRERSSVR